MKNVSENIKLNGEWQLVYDDDNRGRYLDLQIKENFLKQENVEIISVPSCLEEYRQDYEGVAWYHKSFELSEEYSDKCIRISFGAVNYRAEVWINGYPAGMHEGGYVGFEFDITGFIKAGNMTHRSWGCWLSLMIYMKCSEKNRSSISY